MHAHVYYDVCMCVGVGAYVIGHTYRCQMTVFWELILFHDAFRGLSIHVFWLIWQMLSPSKTPLQSDKSNWHCLLCFPLFLFCCCYSSFVSTWVILFIYQINLFSKYLKVFSMRHLVLRIRNTKLNELYPKHVAQANKGNVKLKYSI